MKKLMSLILAATMVFGLAATAMAEIPPEEAGAAVDTSNSGAANSGAGSQAVEIAFEVPETFTWTIPDLQNIEVHPKDQTLDFCIEKNLSISDCYLASDHCIKLGINARGSMTSPDERVSDDPSHNPYLDDAYMKSLMPGERWVQPTEGSIDVPFRIYNATNRSWYWSGTWEAELTFFAMIVPILDESIVMHTDEDVQSAGFDQADWNR